MHEHKTSSLTQSIAMRASALLRVRWVVRGPVWLYRARLGFLFGSRMLMLEHIGRSSGLRRHVVLEIVAHPATDIYVVASGFGAQAQWYRNIRANPQVRIYLGSRNPVAAVAHILTGEESAAALASYATAHPRAWRTLKPVFESTLGARIGDRGTTLPLVGLQLRDPPREQRRQ
ncbi:nitroreductase family deazaflavin-dependent oxidoreductase [Antrihabitans stalactiti]|uniref:Nitroreductase family deazaflavin-dependent oxidoreductase n=1 Tax=Antrihabitans stalactiti TaxID=2584121 RepID=A0A848KMA1_9NOCA|nr:nitroreductase family deazaflavin-dependent oxidoreductase [Antrihabitans stalactiti]NMN99058.1 nitroreductase family deazaflavin-dependent oxidoreductase [Antrihabitans stalactiti]